MACGIIAAAVIIITVGLYAQPNEAPQVKIVKSSQLSKKSDTTSRVLKQGIALGTALLPLNQAQRTAYLKEIRIAGFTEVRYNIDWSLVQKAGPTSYDWTDTDNIMNAVKESGLTPIITLDRTPTWARPAECKTDIFCPPHDQAAFAKFSGLAAARYKTFNVVAWEIWNEPNIVNFWPPLPNPNQYAHMLKEASIAIKKNIPQATVLVGGLAGNSLDSNGTGYVDPRSYLGQLYAAQVGTNFDGVAYHPYTGLKLPSVVDGEYNGWYKMNNGTYTMRSVMTANGDTSKQLWLTEFGEPTAGSKAVSDPTKISNGSNVDHVTEADQKLIYDQALGSALTSTWIHNIDWYNWKDGSGAAYTSGAAYGLVHYDGTPKPALGVIQESMR
ncbi:MAG: glycoside hydrolase family 5 [Candidatus Saccharibacteria bacterium]|nr:glycoside hydrolase family 5 [Candidatus Saccharibacteria bacterium]